MSAMGLRSRRSCAALRSLCSEEAEQRKKKVPVLKAGREIRGIAKEANKSLRVPLPLSPPPRSPHRADPACLFSLGLRVSPDGGEGGNEQEGENGTRGEGNPTIDRERVTAAPRKKDGWTATKTEPDSRERDGRGRKTVDQTERRTEGERKV